MAPRPSVESSGGGRSPGKKKPFLSLIQQLCEEHARLEAEAEDLRKAVQQQSQQLEKQQIPDPSGDACASTPIGAATATSEGTAPPMSIKDDKNDMLALPVDNSLEGVLPVTLDTAAIAAASASRNGCTSSETRRGSMALPKLLDVWCEMEEVVLAPMDSHQINSQDWKSFSLKRRLRRARTGDAVVEEESRFQWLVISPTANRRLIWDILSVIVVMYDLICIPMEAFDPNFRAALFVLDWMTTLFWSLDIGASCFTGFYNEGVIEMRLARIIRRYLRTWFCIDIVTVLADLVILILASDNFDAIGVVRANKTVRLVRVLRFIRLTRLSKLIRVLNELLDKFQSEKLRILAGVMLLLCAIILINHYIACGWYAIGIANWTDSITTWISAQQDRTSESGVMYWYTTSLHWSLTQFTPASMEVHAVSVTERIYSVFVLLFALVAFSSFISSITGSMTLLRQLQQESVQQQAILRNYFLENRISAELFQCIWAYLRKHHIGVKKRLHEKDIPILKQLPEHLLIKMHEELFLPNIVAIPFFESYARLCPAGATELCHRAVSMRSLTAGEVLFLEAEAAAAMYYVSLGTMDYKRTWMMQDLTSSHRRAATKRGSVQGMVHHLPVADGNWVSEPVLWMTWTHYGRIIAQEYSEVMQINAATFRNIVTSELHVSARPVVKRYAQLFSIYIMSEEGEAMRTDIWLDIPVLKGLVQEAELELCEVDALHENPAQSPKSARGGYGSGRLRPRFGSLGSSGSAGPSPGGPSSPRSPKSSIRSPRPGSPRLGSPIGTTRRGDRMAWTSV